MDEYTDPWADDVRAANVLYSSCQMNTHLHWYPELVGKQVQFNISGAGAMNDGTELDELVEREQAAPVFYGECSKLSRVPQLRRVNLIQPSASSP